MGNYCSTRRKSVTGSHSALVRWKDDNPTSITVSETQKTKQVSSSAKSSSSSKKSPSRSDTKTRVSDADKENVSRNTEPSSRSTTPTLVSAAIESEEIEETVTLEEKFEEKAGFVRELKDMTQDEKLEIYGLFKQAKKGDINISQPWGWGEAKYKWNAWKKCEGMSKDEAMREYIEKVDEFAEKYG